MFRYFTHYRLLQTDLQKSNHRKKYKIYKLSKFRILKHIFQSDRLREILITLRGQHLFQNIIKIVRLNNRRIFQSLAVNPYEDLNYTYV